MSFMNFVDVNDLRIKSEKLDDIDFQFGSENEKNRLQANNPTADHGITATIKQEREDTFDSDGDFEDISPRMKIENQEVLFESAQSYEHKKYNLAHDFLANHKMHLKLKQSLRDESIPDEESLYNDPDSAPKVRNRSQITSLSDETDLPFTCDECGKCFATLEDLKLHTRKHENEKSYQCKTCSKRFTSKRGLISHEKLHLGHRPYKCTICALCFTLNKHLKQHMLIHTTNKPFKCDICGHRFTLKQNLTKHSRTHTAEKLFRCNVCGYRCTLKRSLDEHKKKHVEKCDEWDVCKSTFSPKISHKSALDIQRTFQCYVCERSFLMKTTLKRHILTHTSEKPFKCGECGSGFVQRNHLVYHMRMHTGEKPFACPICGCTFFYKSVMERHRKTHSTVRPFKCEVCDFRCSQKANLKPHMMLHTGERPFRCGVCDVGFIRKDSLNRHKRADLCRKPIVVYAGVDEKIFVKTE